jgi:hypothetical protein
MPARVQGRGRRSAAGRLDTSTTAGNGCYIGRAVTPLPLPTALPVRAGRVPAARR